MNESDLDGMSENELVRIIRRAFYELTKGKINEYEFEIVEGEDKSGTKCMTIDVYRSRQKIY